VPDILSNVVDGQSRLAGRCGHVQDEAREARHELHQSLG
jgi:hypothetical protein